MAMRRFSREEFWLELERRGCHRVSEEDDLGSFGLVRTGGTFRFRARMRMAGIPIGCWMI
jgi:hypothetical protein